MIHILLLRDQTGSISNRSCQSVSQFSGTFFVSLRKEISVLTPPVPFSIIKAVKVLSYDSRKKCKKMQTQARR